ncbi:hypothetical protein AB1399_11655, partial [Hydrogenibacillus schlegelii]
PPAVGLVSYVKLTGQFDGFARVLYGFAFFIGLLLVVLFPMFCRVPFFLSWWAYTFPWRRSPSRPSSCTTRRALKRTGISPTCR